MAKATQPVTIGDIEFDALISQDHTYSSTVPQYAVEDGFSVSDAIIFDAETLDMTLFITNTPVTWYAEHGGDSSRVNTVTAQLEEMYYTGEPVTIITSEETFTDMAITSLTISKSTEVGYSREIPISFQKIRKTTSTTTTIPSSYGKSGDSDTSSGTTSTSTSSTSTGSSSSSSSDSSSSGSILYNLMSWAIDDFDS